MHLYRAKTFELQQTKDRLQITTEETGRLLDIKGLEKGNLVVESAINEQGNSMVLITVFPRR